MQLGCEVYHTLKNMIKAKFGQDATNIGDEGGFAPNVQDNYEELNLLMEAIEKLITRTNSRSVLTSPLVSSLKK